MLIVCLIGLIYTDIENWNIRFTGFLSSRRVTIEVRAAFSSVFSFSYRQRLTFQAPELPCGALPGGPTGPGTPGDPGEP